MKTIVNTNSVEKLEDDEAIKIDEPRDPICVDSKSKKIPQKETFITNVIILVKYCLRKGKKIMKIYDSSSLRIPQSSSKKKYDLSNVDSVEEFERMVHEKLLSKINQIEVMNSSKSSLRDELLYKIVQDIKNFVILNNEQLDHLQSLDNSTLFEIIVLYNQMYTSIIEAS